MMFKVGMMALSLTVAAPQAYAFAYLGQNGDRPPLTLQADDSGAVPVIWPDNRLPILVTLNLEGAFRTSALTAMEESWNSVETRLKFVEGSAAADLCNRSDGISAVGWRDNALERKPLVMRWRSPSYLFVSAMFVSAGISPTPISCSIRRAPGSRT